MLRRKSQGTVDGFGGFLGEGTRIDGEVRFSDELRIDGQVTGRIHSDNGRLLVGETGRVEAEIWVGTASISGQVSGTLEASVKVEIHSTGSFRGRLHAPALIIEEGAVFEGQCEMESRPEAGPALAAEAEAEAEAEPAVARRVAG